MIDLNHLVQLHEKATPGPWVCGQGSAPLVLSGMPPEAVMELAKAERENRLVVLPCKLGSKVFVINDEMVRTFFVKHIQSIRNEICVQAECADDDGDNCYCGENMFCAVRFSNWTGPNPYKRTDCE